jgi:hypothetical protein
MKRILGIALALSLIFSQAFGAWDPTRPTDDELKKDVPAVVRANWVAIATGTDAALLITNAKVSPTAGIVDTKLAQITTSNKVSATALCNFSSTPSGAGVFPLANLPGIDSFLASQTGNSGKALITNGSVSSWGYPAGLNISSQAQGDILFYNGSAWTRLGAGTAGYILKTQGAGANPSWLQTLPTANGGTGATAAANAASGVVVLNASSQLPAVSGALLTNLPVTAIDAATGACKNIETDSGGGAWVTVTGLSVSVTLTATGTISAAFTGTSTENNYTADGSNYRIVYGVTPTAIVTGTAYAGNTDLKGQGLSGSVGSIAVGTYTVAVQVWQSVGAMKTYTSGILVATAK